MDDPKEYLARLYRLTLGRAPALPDPPVIQVMIPMIGRADAGDWDPHLSRLQDTLESIARQDYDSFRVLLACQDRPPNLPDDPRYHFVPVPPKPKGRGVDHRHKTRAMLDYSVRTFEDGAYAMNLDADDILHPRLFRRVAEGNNGRGYLISDGYMMDAQTGRLARLDDAPGRVPFWKICGSCAFFALDFRDALRSSLRMRILGKAHLDYARRQRLMGLPLDDLPGPAAIYVVNHGGSVSDHKGKGAARLRYLEKHRLAEAEEAAARAEFGLSPI